MTDTQEVDVLILGAGVSGLYQLYRVRELGLSVRVLEAAGDVGGTWFWNRYPGARFDSESYTYGYSFSKELLDEWNWSEHFAPQPETLKYLQHVTDKFDLRKDISFNSTVTSAIFDESSNGWDVRVEDGTTWRGRVIITAIGILSAPVYPEIEGRDSFEGFACHTARWPHEPVDLAGQRVAVIGTGATGVQVIQELGKIAGELTVFQRSPNYCVPLGNGPIDGETQARIHATYDEILATCRETHTGFIHRADPRTIWEVSDEEREAFFERLYKEPGFGLWVGNFKDVYLDRAANDILSDFVRRKIRERVNNSAVAEKLVPTNHGFGTRRVPLESGYYEVYNQDNVRLVDLRETPITRITPSGIETSDCSHEFDAIVYATGFDAITGAFDRIDIRGVGGRSLKEKWAAGTRTYLGLTVAGFPNLLTIVGPQNASIFCNIPRCSEQNVEWITDLLRHMFDAGHQRFEAEESAEDEWTALVGQIASMTLFTQTDSWFTGVNRNVTGNHHRNDLIFMGGAPNYRARCDEVAAAGYRGFAFS